MRELSLALAVYLRLLLDGRTPFVGKALLIFAVAYGASGRDLFPDRYGAAGMLPLSLRQLMSFADDVILLILAARSFMLLCPQEIVEEHAIAAAQAREKNLKKKLHRRRRAAKDTARSSRAAESG